MEKGKLHQFWINGPRILMLFLFVIAIIGKISSPGSFYVMVNALNLPLYTSEFLLSLLVTTELLMIWLLVFSPDKGIFWSSILLLFFTGVIGGLHIIGIRELCGCFGDAITNDIGIAKFFQNIGLALLLFSSWMVRKKN